MGILHYRTEFRPFTYEWAYDFYKKQAQEMIWSPDEIGFDQDIRDYNHNLSPAEKEFVRKILVFFTQSDVDIAEAYIDNYLAVFKAPELRMMLLSFANMESNHAISYSKVVDTLNIGSYREFLEYPEMMEKGYYHDNGLITHDQEENTSAISRSIVISSVFGEGLQLFGSFIMLLSLVEQGYLPGMGRVVQWSMRDETVHVKGMINIHRELVSEYPELSSDEHKRGLYQIARDMVELEDRFISLVYTDDLELPNLPKPVLHKYIRYLADIRLQQIGLKPVFYVDSNPIPWLSKFEGVVHEDLFDGAGTEYTRSTFRAEEMW